MQRAAHAQILVSCTKGILNDTLETVNQILTRVLPPALHERLAFLSGPSFAAEVLSPQTAGMPEQSLARPWAHLCQLVKRSKG